MRKRIRLLYVQPNSEIGGSDICLVRLIEALDRDRYEPLVLLPGDGPIVPLYERAGAQVRILPMALLRTTLSPGHQGRYLGRFLPTVEAIHRLIEREGIALVHSNSLYCLYGALAALRARRPHIWHLREIPPRVLVARRVLASLTARWSVRVVAMTRACVEGLFGAGSPPAHVTVLAEGLDLAAFRAGVSGQRIRADLGIGPATPLVGFAARMDPWKGLDVFLRAAVILCRSFPELEFVVAGGPPAHYVGYERRMRRRAEELGLGRRVHFTGWRYSMRDMPEVMAAFDVFSHTAISPEPFGLVLIEAMATAKPVVAARLGGPLEIIQDGETGFLTEPGDPEAHAAAVALLLRDPARARGVGLAARRSVEERYTVERFRRELAAIYDQVFRNSPS